MKSLGLDRSAKLVKLGGLTKKSKDSKFYWNKNENGDITTDSTEVKRIIREYDEELYVKKLDNLDEMSKFQETQNLARLNFE